MDGKLFEELIESVKEGGANLRGDREPSRRFEISKKDVQSIRKEIGLSQDRLMSRRKSSGGLDNPGFANTGE